MATWRDRLVPAKFRGVPFFVESTEVSFGRNNAAHEFPFSEEKPFIEDTGKDGNAFTLDAYVIGDDYITARDALMNALNKPGPGELVTPTHGIKRVAVGKCHVRETQSDGGVARFSLQFLETVAAPENPTTKTDAPAALKSSAATAKTAVGAEFSAAYSTATSLKSSVTGALRAISGAVRKALRTVAVAEQTAAELKTQIDETLATVSTLAAQPAALLTAQILMLEKFSDGLSTSNAANPAASMLGLYDVDVGARPPATTPSRELEQGNFDATKQLYQRLVLIQAAELAVDQAFESFDAAVLTRADITTKIDEQLETASDDAYSALQQLRADLMKAVPGVDEDLPRLVEYTPIATLPSLVLAHKIYGDLLSESDILLRNKIAHPGFVLGRNPLEVLSRE